MSRPTEPSTRMAAPCRRADLVLHELDGEALIYDPVSADTHRLNATALFIWQCCDGSHDTEAIATELSQRFDISAPDACPHVEDGLHQLTESRLVECAK